MRQSLMIAQPSVDSGIFDIVYNHSRIVSLPMDNLKIEIIRYHV